MADLFDPGGVVCLYPAGKKCPGPAAIVDQLYDPGHAGQLRSDYGTKDLDRLSRIQPAGPGPAEPAAALSSCLAGPFPGRGRLPDLLLFPCVAITIFKTGLCLFYCLLKLFIPFAGDAWRRGRGALRECR